MEKVRENSYREYNNYLTAEDCRELLRNRLLEDAKFKNILDDVYSSHIVPAVLAGKGNVIISKGMHPELISRMDVYWGDLVFFLDSLGYKVIGDRSFSINIKWRKQSLSL